MATPLGAQLRDMSAGEFGVLLAVILIGAAIAFWLIWRNLRRARTIEDTPTSRIRSAHQGFVELEGMGKPLQGPPIIAPLSQRPCLWYRYKVEESRRAQGGRSSNSRWITVRSGTSDALFALEDGTGTCVVDPDGAEVIPTQTNVWFGSHITPEGLPTPRAFRSLLMTGRYRYTESCLLPGPLYAIGHFNSVSPVGSDARQETSALLREWKTNENALLARFDANKNGAIDPQEWEQARQVASSTVLQERAKRSAQGPVHTLVKPGHGNHPFLISATSQKDLARRHRIHAAAALAVCLVLAGSGYWAWSTRHATTPATSTP